ncbi:MAG: hypothetical protein Q7K42_03570 [Candidatus Diapherotrites archaeon]|nr:hypothetical protein [Candidatus Diapherotrites archaeon]
MAFNSDDEKALAKIVTYAWAIVILFALIAGAVAYTNFKLVEPKPKCVGLPDYLSYEKHSINEKGELQLVLISSKDLNLNKLSFAGTDFAIFEKKSIVPNLWIKKNVKTTIKASGPPQEKSEEFYSNELRLGYNFLLNERQRISVANCIGKVE